MFHFCRWAVVFSLLFFSVLAQPKKKAVTQIQLSGYLPEITNPEFWIKKASDPQKPIWTKERIRLYNKVNLKKGRVLNPFNMGVSIKPQSLKKFIEQDLAFLRRYIKYDTTGKRRRDPEFSTYLKRLIDYHGLDDKGSVTIRYGLVVNKMAELRYAPTELQIFRKKEDREFEILKKSHLSPFAPVAILWESADRKWYFVETQVSRGWVKQEYIASGPRDQIRDFFMGESSGVVINPVAAVYRGEGNLKTEYLSLALPMGNVVYYREYDPNEEFVEIVIPEKSNGKLTKAKYFMRIKDMSPEFLPFTYQNLIRQAFKYLNTDYSWGGSYNGTDCSLFLYRVYRSFGVTMPRSSSKQIISMKEEHFSNKSYPQFSSKLLPLKTLAYISGPTHILLYLGKHAGEDYYIHSTWSFNDSMGNEYLIRSVVVSDLSLGEGSRLGSLEQRITRLGFF